LNQAFFCAKKANVSDASPTTTKSYELEVSSEEALSRLKESLGDDTIVREEEDGVGRFAGARPILLTGKRGESAKLLRGSWSEIKPRKEEPMVELSFVKGEGRTTRVEVHRLENGEGEMGVIGRIIGDVISTAFLIAVAIYAFNHFRGQAIDYTKMAMVVAGATTLYVIAKHFLGTDEENMGPTDWLMSRVEHAFGASESDPGAPTD